MICLDTMVLIWGVQEHRERLREVRNDSHEENVRRAGTYIDHIIQQKEKVLIPAPVLSEFLTGFSFEKANALREIVSSFAVIADYNAATASISADLFRRRREHYGHKVKKAEKPYIKADTMIAAIAYAHKATVIITHDTQEFELYGAFLKQHYQANLRILTVPEISVQAGLPGM